MNLSIRELNELIYCIDIARKYGQLLGTTVADTLAVKLRDELDKRLAIDDDGNYLTIPPKEDIKRSDDSVLQNFIAALQQDEERYRNSHIVSNEEADEDALHMLNSFPIVDPFTSKHPTKERGWIVQAMLDYVDAMGTRTHGQMENYYKFITNGSNSFSHCLINLKVPYKNRKTQRYLAKEGRRGSNAKWVVKSANIHNWVEKDY
jgi:hypothetical protein